MESGDGVEATVDVEIRAANEVGDSLLKFNEQRFNHKTFLWGEIICRSEKTRWS